MKKLSLFGYCAVFFFCSIQILAAATNFEAIFFDIGQGHFTLVYQPDPLESKPRFLLADCGSASTAMYYEANGYNDDIGSRVNKFIKKYTKPSTKKKLTQARFLLDVIISHSDIDHYNLVHKILGGLGTNPQIRVFLLGGKPIDWDTKEWSGRGKEPAMNVFWKTELIASKKDKNIYTENLSDSGLVDHPEMKGVAYLRCLPNPTKDNYYSGNKTDYVKRRKELLFSGSRNEQYGEIFVS